MLSVIIVFCALSFGSVAIVYSFVFPRYDTSGVSGEAHYGLFSEKYPRREVFFESCGNTLAGYIYGEQNDLGLIVFAHGMGSGADAYLPHILYFVEHGWRVFAFDFTGSYESEGASVRGFAQGVYDLDAALDYIESCGEFSSLPVALVGHSWGGFSACAVSAYEKHDLIGIVSLGAPDRPEDIMMHYAKRYVGAFAYSQLPFLEAYETMLFGDAAAVDASGGVIDSGVPALIVHGSDDTTVPFELSVACGVLGQGVTCEIIDGGHTDMLYDAEAWELRRGISEGAVPRTDENLRNANKPNTQLMDKINNFLVSLIA